MDAIQKAVRDGALQRLVNTVETLVHQTSGQSAEFILVLVEPGAGPGQKTVAVLSGVDDDQVPKVLGMAMRAVRGDG